MLQLFLLKLLFVLLFIVLVAYFLRHIENNSLLVLIIGLGFLGAYLPDLLVRRKINN